MFLLPVNFLISFGTFSIPKLSKCVTLSLLTYNAMKWVPIDL